MLRSVWRVFVGVMVHVSPKIGHRVLNNISISIHLFAMDRAMGPKVLEYVGFVNKTWFKLLKFVIFVIFGWP